MRPKCRLTIAGRLDALFDRHAEEQYTRDLLFSTVCESLLLTVLCVHPLVHAAYQAREDHVPPWKAFGAKVSHMVRIANHQRLIDAAPRI